MVLTLCLFLFLSPFLSLSPTSTASVPLLSFRLVFVDAQKLDDALAKYERILRSGSNSVRAKYGVARVLDRKAEVMRSNEILGDAIDAYQEVLNAADVPNSLFKSVAERMNNRMWFKGKKNSTSDALFENKFTPLELIPTGEHGRAVRIQQMMIDRFPDDVSHHNTLVVTLLTLNRFVLAATYNL